MEKHPNLKVDFTALSDFQQCPRLYMWRHLCHLKPSDETAPLFGQCIHAGLEAYQKRRMTIAEDLELPTCFEDALGAFDAGWDKDREEWYTNARGKMVRVQNGRHRDAAIAIFQSYHTWPSFNRVQQIESLETVKGAPLVDGVEYLGKADKVFVDGASGARTGWDLKCHGNRMPPFTETDLMSKQFQGYCELYNVDKWLVEHVSTRVAKANEDNWNGYIVEVRTHEIDRDERFYLDLSYQLIDFRDRLGAYVPKRRFPKHDPGACTRYFKLCPYFDLCLHNVEPDHDFSVTDAHADKFSRESWIEGLDKEGER